jgi:hypothetical protein
MNRALVLVRNIKAYASKIDFGEFILSRIQYPEFQDLRQTFSSEEVYQDDWLLEKSYTELIDAPALAPAGVGGIPHDIEDILFLLRLYKVGDVAFVKQAVVKQDGTRSVQYKYTEAFHCQVETYAFPMRRFRL